MTKIVKIQLILFSALLILWNIFTPILEGADESGHFCHADYIAHKGKIPNIKIQDGCYLWHPPFYYSMLAPIIKVFGLPEYPQSQLEMNPNFNLLRKGEYSQFVHTKEELMLGWGRLEFLVHTLRLFSVLCAIGIFLIAVQLLKFTLKNESQRTLSLLFLFNPMFIHIFTTLTNVTLLSFISALFLFIELKYFKSLKPAKIHVLQGFLLGIGFLTKITFVAAGAFYLSVALLKLRNRPESLRRSAIEILIFISTFMIVTGWYLARALTLYDTPLEINALTQAQGGDHHLDLLENIGPLNYWNSFALTLFRTFWSGYGALTVRFPEILNLVLLISVMLVIIAAIKKWKRTNAYFKLSALYLAVTFITLIIGNFTLSAMHAKDLFPAYLPISFLFAYGASNLTKVFKKNGKMIFLGIPVAIYFFAQNEVVGILKLLFFQESQGAYLKPLIVKVTTVLALYGLIYQGLKKLKINNRWHIKITFTLFVANIVILAISTYLFYS
ncbi:MAG: hypothetical protein NUV69_04085 [Candidatus Curtissbacteria bacterium]|nr:hypothetical protein [Candidatus Curtissbacteria bacterium]